MSDDRKLSALPLAGALSGSDALLVVNQGASRRTSLSTLSTYLVGGLATQAEVNTRLAQLESSTTAGLAQKQPLDDDLSAIAALSTASYGRSLLTMTDAGAAKTALAITATDVSGLSAAADGRIAAQKGAALGLAPLDSAGKVPGANLPALALVKPSAVASQAAQLALSAQEGDVAVRSDLSKTFMHNGGTSASMADWTELLSPTTGVASFNTRAGAVTLSSGDVTTALGFTPAGLTAPVFTTPSLGAASATSMTFSAAGGGGKVALNGATSNWIEWSASGVAAPSYTTRSVGTKLLLYPTLTASQADFAIGVEGSYTWFTAPVASANSQGWKWYGGVVEAARLTTDGTFTAKTVQGTTASFSANDHYFGDGSASGRLNLRKVDQANDAGINLYTGASLRWIIGEMGSSVGNTGQFYIHRPGVGVCLSIEPASRRATFGSDVEVTGVLAALGGGIAFPPTQVASADNNTLDDYKEGSWTPTLTFGGSAAGNVYLHQIGSYTKVGRMVHASAYISLQSKGSATGDAAIGGLPFTVASRGVASLGVRLTTPIPELWGNCGQGGATIPIFSGTSATTHASFDNGCEINMTLTFSV